MTRTTIIAPSILSADFTRLGEQIAEAEAAGADWVHVDVMDGHFVPNLTMGPFIVEHVRRVTKLPIDVHLMVTDPGSLLEAFASAGASHLTVHIEACARPELVLARIQALGCTAGLSLNPATPASALEAALPAAGLVLVMTVQPGYSGQAFRPEVLPKIAELRARLDAIGSSAWLEVDGGVNAATLPGVHGAGADAVVAANAVFHHPQGIAEGIRSLRAALETGQG